MNTLNDPENQSLVPQFVLLNKDILFGNIREIYNFHSK